MVALAERGVRSSVVRLPPSVHGDGRAGFGSELVDIARRTGESGYLGGGSTPWPSAQVADVAAVIGERLGVPVRSIPDADADAHFGFLVPFVRMGNPASGRITRELLGWEPRHPRLLADLADPANPAWAA